MTHIPELISKLRAVLAEVEFELKKLDHGDYPEPDDISPKLRHALNQPHDISQALNARANEAPEPSKTQADAMNRFFDDHSRRLANPEKPERLKDYTPADDPDWDIAPFLGTGDHKLP
jgi:hypothetical protein